MESKLLLGKLDTIMWGLSLSLDTEWTRIETRSLRFCVCVISTPYIKETWAAVWPGCEDVISKSFSKLRLPRIHVQHYTQRLAFTESLINRVSTVLLMYIFFILLNSIVIVALSWLKVGANSGDEHLLLFFTWQSKVTFRFLKYFHILSD